MSTVSDRIFAQPAGAVLHVEWRDGTSTLFFVTNEYGRTQLSQRRGDEVERYIVDNYAESYSILYSPTEEDTCPNPYSLADDEDEDEDDEYWGDDYEDEDAGYVP